jgi:hypothetical protein
MASVARFSRLQEAGRSPRSRDSSIARAQQRPKVQDKRSAGKGLSALLSKSARGRARDGGVDAGTAPHEEHVRVAGQRDWVGARLADRVLDGVDDLEGWCSRVADVAHVLVDDRAVQPETELASFASDAAESMKKEAHELGQEAQAEHGLADAGGSAFHSTKIAVAAMASQRGARRRPPRSDSEEADRPAASQTRPRLRRWRASPVLSRRQD